MRGIFVIAHRWVGLFIAVFLFVAGLTGAVISWDHELDGWLNPELFTAKQTGKPLPPLELVAKFEAAHPEAQVIYFPLSYEAGETAEMFITPRIDPATGEPYALEYNQVYVEPVSGDVVGKRYWGRISLSRADLLPFLYKLHYSMHVPDFFNFDRWGVWLMGIVGIVWMFDCFVGFYLTLPSLARNGGQAVLAMPSSRARAGATFWERWKPAWRIKRGASTYRLNLDLHRAFGLWFWLLLFILAFTSVSMNLGTEVVRPLLATVSTLTPDVDDTRTPAPLNKPIKADQPFAHVIDEARNEAQRRDWKEPLGSAFYDPQIGVYQVSFFQPGDEHGSGGMGVKTLYFDGKNGALLGDHVPWKGTAADVFMQLQFPLHSGRIAGVPGRIALTILGLVVALLSITGVVIWFKKRHARLSARILNGKSTPVMPTPTPRLLEVTQLGVKHLILAATKAGRGRDL